MSVEAQWYSSYDENGEPPRCRRLSRYPMRYQWAAAIRLAIEFSSGEAGYRPVTMRRTGEHFWHWPGGDLMIPDTRRTIHPSTGWWLVPPRVVRRAMALYQAATNCECTRGRGSASSESVTARLRVWERTGQWIRIASQIAPRSPGPGKRRRGRKRRTGKPARNPRSLP